MVIMHNMSAANANRQVSTGEKVIADSAEKLSSGYRVNRAADDAAGLTISEKMRWQVRGLGRASDNSRDGISYIQTAEGALGEMHALMQRSKELSVQAANDTNTDLDRAAIQKELDQLVTEIDRISSTTQYNTMNVFGEDGRDPYAVMDAPSFNVISVTYGFIDQNGAIQPITGGNANKAVNYTGDKKVIADYVASEASKAAQAVLAAYPALAGASSANIQIGLNLANIDGTGKVLASAALSMRWSGSSTEMTFTMNVDTSDYNINNYNDGGLAATIAHEMTHLIMQDTLTSGMLGRNSEPYPLWFVEGMAQTASGDDGWLSNRLNANSSDAAIKNYLSQTASMPYGAGYLSTLYLAQMASGQTAVSTASLRNGLNKIMGDMVGGSTLSQVIAKYSNGKYANYKAFEKGVGNDAAAVQFTKDFIAARGANGAGSVIAPSLTTLTPDILNASSPYANSYKILTNTTAYTNIYGTGFTFPDKGNASGTGGGGSGSGGSSFGGDGLMLQVGSLGGQGIALGRFNVSSAALLKGGSLSVMSFEEASDAMMLVEDAISAISNVRSYYGAMQNRLEHVIANLDNSAENTQAAESRIRDTDMAEEMVAYSSANVIAQAAQSMLAQANQSTNSVLSLLNA